MVFEDYDFEIEEDIHECRKLLQLKYEQRCKKYKRKGQEYIYPEQKEYATQILEAFKNDNIFISTFIAPVQWGKTGVSISLIHQCVTDEEIFFNPKHIYVITGLNDNEWKAQTQDRMLKEFRENVYHLSDLYSLDISDAQDALIIIDECQVANMTHQTIRKMLVRNGIKNLDDLKDRNIRILQTSATPDNVLVDCLEYDKNEHFTCIVDIKADKQNSYKFFTDIPEDNLKESMDLEILQNVDELFKDILSYQKERWHIIRIPGDSKGQNITMDNIIFGADIYNCDIKYHMIGSSIDDDISPEEVLLERPSSGKHTIILVKNKWRASKSIPDKYIGVVHDRYTREKVKYAAEVQSLAGRMIGHGKMKKRIKPIIYCKKECIKEYIKLFKNNFDFNETLDWKKLKKPSYINKDIDDM
tara:strand:- start:927 stop:2171 length:1245 start_codon:yes stop_codon:yes gene_type:complete